MDHVFLDDYFADENLFTNGFDMTEDDECTQFQGNLQQFPHLKCNWTPSKRKRYDIFEYLMDNPLKMLGLSREGLREKCISNQFEISLDNKINSMLNKFRASKSTTRQYVRRNNVFLIWLYQQQDEDWEEKNMLLMDHNMVFRFLHQCQMGEIGWTGVEPPLSLIVEKKLEYKIPRSKIRFSLANGMKLLSALADLFSIQHMFLGTTNFTILRHIPLIKQFEANLKALEISESNLNTEPQNTIVFGGGCPIEAKLAHSSHLLLEDGFVNMRNRALTLAQCFSISRFQEVSYWRLSDLVHFSYSQRVPRLFRQKIRVILVEQRRHKTKKSSEPDLKVLVRHRDAMLCPLGAISMFIFIRFNIVQESPIDFLDNTEQWKKKMLFRTTNDPNQSVSSTTSYMQKRAYMETTGTKVSNKCNHTERHHGSLIASMSGLPSDQIEKIGLWNSKTSTSHYEKYLSPASLAQLSGFVGVEDYFIRRASRSIDQFCKENPEAENFFGSFMPFLIDPVVREAINSSTGRSNSLKNTYQSLLYLKEIFYQDIGVIWTSNPNSIIFKSNLFQQNWEVFQKWLQYIQEDEAEVTKPHEGVINEDNSKLSDMGNAILEVKEDIRQLMANDSLQSAQLTRILHLLQSGNLSTNGEDCIHHKKRHKASYDQEDDTNKGEMSPILIKEMRPLNDMNLKELLQEWYDGFFLNGRKYRSLKELEEGRTLRKEQYYQHNLKTSIARRRQLMEYFESVVEKMGSKIKAHEFIEEKRRDLKLTSLYKLWKWTRKQG